MVGAFTRLSDAGLGCPDWPGCYGHLTVPETAHALKSAAQAFPGQVVEASKAWTEMGHRYIAGILGLLILFLGVSGLISYRKIRVHPVLLVAMMVVVVCQALLGMWTVTLKLMPIIVMGHLIGGFTTLSLLWWTTLKSNNYFANLQPEPMLTRIRPWAIAAIVIVVLQIALGGWTSSNYAALSCQGLPFCHANASMHWAFGNAFQLWTPFDHLSAAAKATIQMCHRMGAIVVAVYVGWLAIRVMTLASSKALRNVGIAMLVLLFAQIILGLLNIILSLPLPIAVLHNGFAAVLLLSVLTLNFALTRVSSSSQGKQ
tara:strand:- start:59195 stop:60139 length:945 start_codon:yes stop_codon:yes gene_type:complete